MVRQAYQVHLKMVFLEPACNGLTLTSSNPVNPPGRSFNLKLGLMRIGMPTQSHHAVVNINFNIGGIDRKDGIKKLLHPVCFQLLDPSS